MELARPRTRFIAFLAIFTLLFLVVHLSLHYATVRVSYSVSDPAVDLRPEMPSSSSSLILKDAGPGEVTVKVPGGRFVVHLALVNEGEFYVFVESVTFRAEGGNVSVTVGGVPAGGRVGIVLSPGDGADWTVCDAGGTVHKLERCCGVYCVDPGIPGATRMAVADFTWISISGVADGELEVALSISVKPLYYST